MKDLLVPPFTLGLAWAIFCFGFAYPCGVRAAPGENDSNLAEKICPVHEIKMTVERVEILYGLPSPEFLEAYGSFRGGPGFVFGGCVVGEMSHTEGLTCAKCVAGYEQWLEEARVRWREGSPFADYEDAVEVSVGTDYAQFAATYRRTPSNFFEEFTMKSVLRIFANEGISASGRIIRHPIPHDVAVTQFVISCESRTEALVLQNLLITSIEDTLQERELRITGQALSEPPESLSIFFEGSNRYGGIHCTFVSSERSTDLIFFVHEGPVLNFTPTPDSEQGDAGNGGNALEEKRSP